MKKTKPMPKQVKSFSVDGEIYEWLIMTLKEAGGGDLSISSLINDYLAYLYYELKIILDYYDNKGIVVDRSWVVNEIIRESYLFPPKLDILYADPDMKKWMEQEIESKALDLLDNYRENKKRLLRAMKEKREAIRPKKVMERELRRKA